MRENLFKGKRKDNGEWVEGFLFQTIEHTYIAYAEQFDDDLFLSPKNIFIEVITETVGQYTGLTDKNGKKIFEGDIVKGTFFGFPMPIENYVFTIGWQEDVAGYKANYFENVEIIGNIHDNPELLKGSVTDTNVGNITEKGGAEE